MVYNRANSYLMRSSFDRFPYRTAQMDDPP